MEKTAKKPKKPPVIPHRPEPKPAPKPPDAAPKPEPRPEPAATPKPAPRPTPGPTPDRPDVRPPERDQEPAPSPKWTAGRPEAPPPRETRPATPADVHGTVREVVPSRHVPETRVERPSSGVPIAHTADHRYARPDPFVPMVHPVHPYPHYRWYRPYWTHWWVHPYWRWTHATVVIVPFVFVPAPWDVVWVPPVRPGWVWVPGHRSLLGFWIPGHWAPVGPPPTVWGGSWVYVPGWWMGPVYVEGYWRLATRPGWTWVDGYYLDDGSYVRGWWVPAAGPPRSGYVWEGGYWDGEYWVEGFWRPRARSGYRWVSSWLDDAGIFHAGFWEPLEDKPGMVWIPGWFDGEQWVEGYWVPEQEYRDTDPEKWQPDEGWDLRAPEGGAPPDAEDEPPPALPVRVEP